MEDRLRECPFCGGESEIISYSSYGSVHYYIRCRNCESKTKSVLAKEKLFPLWNTRATDPLMEEMARALKLMMNIYYGRDKQSYPGQFAKMADEALQKYREATFQQGAR